MSRKIFTFWEPKNKLPGYIELCMQTWERFLPEYEIVVCDYENITKWLTPEEFNLVDFRKMPLAKQSDAIRCALLAKHGGIWMDADTILTGDDSIKVLQMGECCMLNTGKPHVLFGAYIYASKSSTLFLERWLADLHVRIAAYKKAYKWRFFRLFFKKKWKEMKKWDYCVNAIIDPLSAQLEAPDFVEINGSEKGVIPERRRMRSGESFRDAYLRYWFDSAEPLHDEDFANGIIFLHNSWTPSEYRAMSADEFLQQNIPMARLLKNLLK